ncbi:MAG: S41 family peptidase [Ruminiclostridium sp.]
MKQIYSKTKLIFIACMLFLMVGCGIIPSKDAYLSKDRNEQWVKDIQYIKDTLPKVHKNLYFKISEKDFFAQLDELMKKVPNYTNDQIEIELSKTISSIGDTHTSASIGPEFMYPLELHWFEEGIYITGTSEEYKELLDAKLLTFNGKKIEEVANTLKPLFTGANESWFKTQVIYYLPFPAILKYFGISNSDELELSVELTSGEVKKVNMKPIKAEEYVAAESTKKSVPMYKTHPNENYWYEYLQKEKILYMNYNSCRQMRDKPFEIFSKELWNYIDSQEVEKFVLDIRNNRGGISTILDPFIKELKKSSFNENNKLYVIIGKDTFSSAILNAISLKNETKAYFVGEATGGEPNHYGEVKKFMLPNSQIPIGYSTKYFNWSKEDIATLKPDKLIKETFEAYQKAEDPVLEWIVSQK